MCEELQQLNTQADPSGVTVNNLVRQMMYRQHLLLNQQQELGELGMELVDAYA